MISSQRLHAKKKSVSFFSVERKRRLVQYLLLVASSVFIANALLGTGGLIDTLEARKRFDRLQQEILQLQSENKALRIRARRLQKEPSAIEEIARRELGLIKPGELLFLLNDSNFSKTKTTTDTAR